MPTARETAVFYGIWEKKETSLSKAEQIQPTGNVPSTTSFFSANTIGVFSLGVMDNGNDRIFPVGVTCGSSGGPPCLYSTVPVWQIDESAKTAHFHQISPPNLYNSFGGNTDQLANGNVEYDLCGIGVGVSIPNSSVHEVTQESTARMVWNMQVTGTYLYRAFRIPSLYPGVQ